MATWDDSDSEEEDSDEEQANVALMATTVNAEVSGEPEEKMLLESESDSDSDSEEVLSKLSRSELEACLSEMLERYQSLQSKYKDLKQINVNTSEARDKLKQNNSSLNEFIFSLKFVNCALNSKVSKLEEELVSSISTDYVNKYDRAFQHFLAKSIDKSKLASMIYGVSRNGRRGLGCVESILDMPKFDKRQPIKLIPLYDHFVPSGTKLECSELVKALPRTQKSDTKYHAQIPLDYPVAPKPQVVRNSGKTNKRGPKKWVPKDKIIYVADIISSSVETPIMVPGQ